MIPTLQELKDAASGLPASDRVELAQFLLHLLDEQDEQGVLTEWLALAEQRMAENRAGKVFGVPAENVKLLGQSKEFRRFLKERSKEAATATLEDYRRSLD
jgi:hypothetical protein